MTPIREVYPDQKDGSYWFCVGDYGPLLESLGHVIALQVDDRDYQGDSRLLLRDGARVGFLQFGWGSCSGCDALQACQSYEELEKLRNELVDAIRWFDDAPAALAWFNAHDWEGDYSWHEDEQRRFVSEATKLLEGLCDSAPAATA